MIFEVFSLLHDIIQRTRFCIIFADFADFFQLHFYVITNTMVIVASAASLNKPIHEVNKRIWMVRKFYKLYHAPKVSRQTQIMTYNRLQTKTIHMIRMMKFSLFHPI